MNPALSGLITQNSPRIERLPALDGLRGVAVLLVLLFHVAFGNPAGGFLGVDVFFVLSGFLITQVLRREVTSTGALSLSEFYWRRFRRLAPALVVTLVFAGIYAASGHPEALPLGFPVTAGVVVGYIGNWFGAQRLGMLAHTWSLSIEEQFYWAWPLVLSTLAAQRRSAQRLAWLAGLGAGVAFVGGVFLALHDFQLAYLNTLPRAGELLVGAVVALLVEDRSRLDPVMNAFGTRLASVSAVSIVLVVLFSREESFVFYGPIAVVTLATGCIVGHVTVTESIVTRVLSFRPLQYVGKISYGLYLYYVVGNFLIQEGTLGANKWVVVFGRTVVTFVVAAVSFRFLEDPIRKMSAPRWWPGSRARTSAISG